MNKYSYNYIWLKSFPKYDIVANETTEFLQPSKAKVLIEKGLLKLEGKYELKLTEFGTSLVKI